MAELRLEVYVMEQEQVLGACARGLVYDGELNRVCEEYESMSSYHDSIGISAYCKVLGPRACFIRETEMPHVFLDCRRDSTIPGSC